MVAKRLAVIGDPIAHSLSPLMQCAALRAAGLADWSHEAHQVSPTGLTEYMREFRSGDYHGLNITIPHKVPIRSYVDLEEPSATRTGAVNTILRSGESLVGHNTDLPGFKAALRTLRDDVRGVPALVFGAGGAARAVIQALADLGVRLTIANRTLAHAQELARSAPVGRALSLEDPGLPAEIERARLIVNTSSLGMGHLAGASPLPADCNLHPDTAVMDLVYGRETPLLRQARLQGCAHQDGIEMLVQQGAESFRLWTGLEPDLDVMRDACHSSAWR